MDKLGKIMFPRIKIELTHEQTQQLLDITDVGVALTTLGALALPIPAAMFGAFFQLNKILITRKDKGNGVIISFYYLLPPPSQMVKFKTHTPLIGGGFVESR